MDRRNFLAYIPSVSAIPFIGLDIVDTKEKIEIIKPTPLEVVRINSNNFNWMDCEVQITYKGQILGKGYLTELSMTGEQFGPKNIEISATILNLINGY